MILPTLADIVDHKVDLKQVWADIETNIVKNEGQIGAYLDVFDDAASDKTWPIALKDNISVMGHNTTCASKFLANYQAGYDATVVTKLNTAGATVMGKLNMDEFAMGSSTETSALGKTVNPWATNRITGGSSGGSAAAVASAEAIVSLGTDTGGSIRQPASMCGVVGMKPTYGRVSRYGVVAMASSLDQVGTLTQTVADSAILLNTIAGYDKHDATSLNIAVPDWRSQLQELDDKPLKGLKLGLPQEYMIADLQVEVKEAILAAATHLQSLGAEIKEVNLINTKYAISSYYVIMPAEVSTNLARFDGIRFGSVVDQETVNLEDFYLQNRSQGFGPEVKRRIILGSYVLSAGYGDKFYKKAQAARKAIINDFDQVWDQVDAIIGPTTPETAWELGTKITDPHKMHLADIFTIPANMAGLPALSLPCGFDKNNLPIGLQIQAPRLKEDLVFKISHAFEQTTDFHNKKNSFNS